MTTLLQAQTSRLTAATDVTSQLAAAVKLKMQHAADGTVLYVRKNTASSDVLVQGTDKSGVERSIRFTTRSRGRVFRQLDLSCMATITEAGKRVGRVIFSLSTASSVLGGLGITGGGRALSLTFELLPDGKLQVDGTSSGMSLPATLKQTIDPKQPHDSLTAWIAAATDTELAKVSYFDPLLKHVAARYRNQQLQLASKAGLDASSLVAAIASLQKHRERALSAPAGGDGGKALIKGAAACVIGGLAGALGGPLGAAFGCVGGFDAAMASEMIDDAYSNRANNPPSGNDGQGGNAPYTDPNPGDPGNQGDDGDWGGVCGPDGDGGSSPGGAGCFVAGTVVATPEGPIAIDTLAATRTVWAGDPDRPGAATRTIERVLTFHSTRIVELDFGDEIIRCTPPHPFFTGEWTRAGDLVAGARVKRRDGTWQVLRAVTTTDREVPVYDLTVADRHTYFVGACELLVHNKSPTHEDDPWSDGSDDGAD
jgi:pretoxin HINT domain-containing protein